MRVMRHADNSPPLITSNDAGRCRSGNLNSLPDRVLPGPEAARRGFADDGDERSSGAIVACKRAAAHDAHTERLEDLRPAHLCRHHRKARAIHDGLSLGSEPYLPDAIAEQRRHDNLRSCHNAWYRANATDDRITERQRLWPARVLPKIERVAENREVIAHKAGVLRLESCEAAHEQ